MVSPLPVVGIVLVAAALAAYPVSAADYRPPRPDLGFPIYTNQPPGRQLAGQHAPAATPALSPAEAQARFTVPEGFDVRLFASEPEVVNPVAMTWDERGRLWVVELYEYPLGAAAGATPRDRVKILEDTDADGRADRVHVWADGLNLATGIALGHGGAYVGQAPHLLFLKDTDGDDRADSRTVVQTGFGLEDRHELLNGFTWGPDGSLYMTHGVFTRSKVIDPDRPHAEPVVLTAGVARWRLREPRRFEVFAEGTSNPWGVDFDREGQAFVSACVIEHLFHLIPGGIYDRQAGTPPFPYAYESLHAINDHRHHMAAYAGVQVYQGDQYPTENLGTILQGNIHDNAVHQDRLARQGAGYVASRWRDLVRANDGWFMPVSVQTGPDGAIWIMDWYDRYPCYQNANADPAGVDREHGRIWRVVHTGSEKSRSVPSRPERAMNLAALESPELAPLLEHPNVWHRRTAQRLLSERGPTAFGPRSIPARTPVHDLLARGRTLQTRLAALWTLHGMGLLDEADLEAASRDPEPALRAWSARLTGERGLPLESARQRLVRLAGEPDPRIRLATATAARQWVSGSLTVDTPPSIPIAESVTEPILHALVRSSSDAGDPLVTYMIWMALEPIVAFDPVHVLKAYERDGAVDALPLSGVLLAKILRRTCDLGDREVLDRALRQFGRIPETAVPVRLAGLAGLLEAQRGGPRPPGPEGVAVVSRWAASTNAELARSARHLAALWGDAEALASVLRAAADPSVPADERVRAIQTARATRTAAVRDTLMSLVSTAAPEGVQTAAINALAGFDEAGVAEALLGRWRALAPGPRSAVAGVLASRPRWALALLGEIRAGRIASGDLGTAVVRSLVGHRDEVIRREAATAIGRYRESSADKAGLVAAKRRVALTGEPDLAAGRRLAQEHCLVCHQLFGEGQTVGPDLTGVGRSSLEALLWNIIDPNQVIGAGYEQVEIETRDDRVLAGRLVEQTDTRVRLLQQGGKEEVVGRENILHLRTLESSVMPEGLEQLPEAAFRDLVWYILAPPQEGPLTPAKRDRLAGRPPASSEGPLDP